jgi:hypothetical protein
MTHTFVINYNSLLENPILKLITFFNFALLLLWLFFSLFHAGSYSGLISYQFILFPLLNLLLIGAFTESITITSNTDIVHEKKFFYIKTVRSQVLGFNFKNEKNYSSLFIQTACGEIQTGMMYKANDSKVYMKQMIDKCNSFKSS